MAFAAEDAWERLDLAFPEYFDPVELIFFSAINFSFYFTRNCKIPTLTAFNNNCDIETTYQNAKDYAASIEFVEDIENDENKG